MAPICKERKKLSLVQNKATPKVLHATKTNHSLFVAFRILSEISPFISSTYIPKRKVQGSNLQGKGKVTSGLRKSSPLKVLHATKKNHSSFVAFRNFKRDLLLSLDSSYTPSKALLQRNKQYPSIFQTSSCLKYYTQLNNPLPSHPILSHPAPLPILPNLFKPSKPRFIPISPIPPPQQRNNLPPPP
jgi:hypothetical protein